MDGDTLWVAGESIEQSCTFEDFMAALCQGSRSLVANWGRRITSLHIGGDGNDHHGGKGSA